MAQSGGRRASSNKKTNSTKRRGKRTADFYENTIIDEVFFLLSVALSVLLFLCNFHIIGPFGDMLSSFMFGLFGYMAYAAPLLIFFAVYFWIANMGNRTAFVKLIAGIILFCMLCVCFTMFAGVKNIGKTLGDFYHFSADNLKGGGIIGGFLGNGMYQLLSSLGTWIVVITLMLICMVLLTEKSFRNQIKNSGLAIADYMRDDMEHKKELALERSKEREAARSRREQHYEETGQNDKERRIDKKISGIATSDELNIKSKTDKDPKDKIDADALCSEIINENSRKNNIEAISKIKIRGIDDKPISENPAKREMGQEIAKSGTKFDMPDETESFSSHQNQINTEKPEQISRTRSVKPKGNYKFPDTKRLKPGAKKGNTDNGQKLRETALRLQETLHTFGVEVTVTDISQGPSVTRYELQPEVGVKVSKIVNLADDIKLNLAATDIRIEAPIPGKAAVGIEVPNSENTAVAFRDLIESEEFKNAQSKISVAVGKDIGGNIVVADIAKMPHLLIAGATGSGKSVCINTIIMSILFKATPEEVRMIMIDPKVVELSVYNDIPHLLIPVVTDPKKAAAALQWGVKEMEERYRRFADLNVRDLKGYNQKVGQMTENNGQPIPEKMPQILIIVDELADLMMVATNEVEEAICRLAQLARACGIHLIIATQRPSVDVITGLIKANMPSRIAFAVSSGVDSRTILDMVGAEKLLGKGDMLFYPQGKSKPDRVQGAFISDQEVSDIVEFIKAQDLVDEAYAADIEEKIAGISTGSMAGGGFTEAADERDPLFKDAGYFIIEKEKASIGMLQRVFKIGFNRAARIMDQLEEIGVVGPEMGTKPRTVNLQSREEFDRLLNNAGEI